MLLICSLLFTISLSGTSVECQCPGVSEIECHEMVVLQHLAECQSQFDCENFSEAYSHSKKAIMILETWDHLYEDSLMFISLFQHVIACDQTGRVEECYETLAELNVLAQEIMERYSRGVDDESIPNFCTLYYVFYMNTMVKTQEVRDALLLLKERLLSDFYIQDEEFSTIAMPLENQPVIEAKKIWKRSLSWWRKQFEKWVQKIFLLKEFYKEAEKLYEELSS